MADPCELGDSLLQGHPYLGTAIYDVGSETIAAIGVFLGGIPAAPSMAISPGLRGEAIHSEVTS